MGVTTIALLAFLYRRAEQDLSAYRTALLIVPCPSHKKNFTVKLQHFVHTDAAAENADARASAIALPVYLYR